MELQDNYSRQEIRKRNVKRLIKSEIYSNNIIQGKAIGNKRRKKARTVVFFARMLIAARRRLLCRGRACNGCSIAMYYMIIYLDAT